jgi:hypothetical protein
MSRFGSRSRESPASTVGCASLRVCSIQSTRSSSWRASTSWGAGLNRRREQWGLTTSRWMPRRVEALGRLPVFRAAGSAGPGGNATPGRVLGSGEDVRTVPSWRPLRSASNGAPARSHHEELAEKAPATCGPRGVSVARFTVAALLRDHNGSRWRHCLRVASGRLGQSPMGCGPINRPGG